MDPKKRAKLEAAGYTVGSVQDFLQLTDAEAALIEIKLALAAEIRAERARKRMSQKALATLIESSQPRVVRMERGEGTIDLLARTLVALGVSRTRLGDLVSGEADHQHDPAQSTQKGQP